MSDALSKLSSPLEITLEWTRTLPEPQAVLSLAAFELKKWSDKVEDFESAAFLGTAIDTDGKATTKDGGIRLGVLDVTDNMAPVGKCSMSIDLEKVSSEKIRLCVCAIPEKKGKKLLLRDCVSAKVSIKDASGQTCSCDVVKAVAGATSMALGIGTLKGGRSWSYKEEIQLLDGGIEKLLETYVDKKIYSQHPYSQESIHKDLHKRISIYYAECLERARIEEEANKARRAAEEAARLAEARRRFEEEKARLAAEEEARRKAEEEERLKAEEEERRRIEAEEARQRAEEEAIRKAAEEAARLKAEAEKKAKKAAEEAKAKAEAEAKAKRDAEEAAKREEEKAAEAERKRKEEEEKAANNVETPSSSSPAMPRSGSKRWKHQVTKMHEGSEPVSVTPPGETNVIPPDIIERKTKAWKSARFVRHEDLGEAPLEPESVVPTEAVVVDTPPAPATRSLGGSKKWKGQVPRRQETEEPSVVDTPAPLTDQTQDQSVSTSKRKFPKINR